MPRPLRDFRPGGSYHLGAHGNDRRDIFVDDHDRTEFVNRLARTAVRFRINVQAWCLTTNQYGLAARPEDWRWAGAVGSAA